MFKGEPLALHTMLISFFAFNFVLLLGLDITGLINLPLFIPTQIHYLLVFFGWIAGLILGAQLQFFRAIAGVRKYEPEILRSLYLTSYVTSLVLMITGTTSRTWWLFYSGLVVFFLFLLIHSYWLGVNSQSKLFKFPLEYFGTSHLFLLGGILLLLIQNAGEQNVLFASKTMYTHILVVGWISLSLQGAIIRILPMFLGQTIDRQSRSGLNRHFLFSVTSSVLIASTFIVDVSGLWHGLLSLPWIISWGWTIRILIKSIRSKFSELDRPYMLYFVAPGFVFLIIGSLMGFVIFFVDYPLLDIFRRLHIHYSMLFGLSLIMLGLFSRISGFQIYSILSAGDRKKDFQLDDFLFPRQMKFIAIWIVIQLIWFTIGVVVGNFTLWGIGGTLVLAGVVGYDVLIGQNVMVYFREKSRAIPFDKKPSEV